MQCIICYNNIKTTDKFLILNCNCTTAYHNICITKWLTINKSCPTCRISWPKPKLLSKLLNKSDNIAINTRYDILRKRLFLESIGINSYKYSP